MPGTCGATAGADGKPSMAANAPKSLRSNPAGRLVGGADTVGRASRVEGNAADAGADTADCGGSKACARHANRVRC